MRRDMDFIRELLLEIESGKKAFETISTKEASMLGFEAETPMDEATADRLRYHLDLLEDGGLAEISRAGGGMYYVDKLTWNGHQFLDSVRDSEVWRKTTATAKKAGAGTIEMFWVIAKEIAKAEVKRHMGFDIS